MKNTTAINTRRDFVKLAAGGLAGVAAAGVLAGCSAESSTQGSSGGNEVDNNALAFDAETDVLILGGGSGGAFAAHFALEAGKRVILIEASPTLGGTLLSAGGGFHTWNLSDPDQIAKQLPYADEKMIKLFMETFNGMREWMVDTVPNCTPLNSPNPVYADIVNGVMMGPGIEEKVEAFEFLTEGADVQLETWARELLVNEAGEVIGAVVEDGEGKQAKIGAKATIIATGSFPANKEQVVKYLGRWADKATIRATPYNTGGGIAMAQEAGAIMSKGVGHFYGHLVPWPSLFPQTIEEYEETDINTARTILSPVQALSVEGIALNTNGLRYSDESFAPFVGDNYLANDTVQQEGAHAFIVIDSAEDHKAQIDMLNNAGAVVEQAETAEELAEKISAHGYNGFNVLKTIKEYQAAAQAGTTNELTIPKSPMQSGYLTKLDTPPFIAVQAGPGISAFYGGLKIDEACRVLGYQEKPIPGLYAVPMAAGGIFYKEYAGSLALCAAFGKIAGETVGSL